MSATIMMPTQIESAIREMCTDAMSQAVAALAEKYGFDAEEANRFLSTSDVKIVRKRGPSPKKDEVKKEPKAKADKADKPKRGKTGYLLYADEVRAEVKAELVAAMVDDEKLKPQDVVKAIAARWKGEEQDVRDEWNAKAKTPATSDDEAEPKVEPKAKVKAEAKTEAKTEAKAKTKPKKTKEPEPEPEAVSDADSDED